MIYLKIEHNVGMFYKDGTYVTIDKMGNGDLWRPALLYQGGKKSWSP